MMFRNAKQKQKSNQNDINGLVPSISMPSLVSKTQMSMAKPSFEMRQNNGWQMKQKTAAETINETRRMLSNGIYLIVYFFLRKIMFYTLFRSLEKTKKLFMCI